MSKKTLHSNRSLTLYWLFASVFAGVLSVSFAYTSLQIIAPEGNFTWSGAFLVGLGCAGVIFVLSMGQSLFDKK